MSDADSVPWADFAKAGQKRKMARVKRMAERAYPMYDVTGVAFDEETATFTIEMTPRPIVVEAETPEQQGTTAGSPGM